MIRSVIVVVIIVAAVNGEVTKEPRALISKRIGAGNCDSGRRQDCVDCHTVKICSYDQIVLTKYRCQDVDPTMPYCNGAGECSASPDSALVCVTPDDLCPHNAPGFYPDPTNCTRYIYCDDNMVSYPESCLVSSNVYNQTTASCFLKRRAADCFQVDCKNTRNKGKWFIYTPFPQLYFLCSENGPLLFRCPRETDVFDVDTKRCEFQCPYVGRFTHPSGSDMYYECVSVTTSKIEKFERKCTISLVFDVEKQRCVAETM